MKIHKKMYLLFNLDYGKGKPLKSFFYPHLPSWQPTGNSRAQSSGSFVGFIPESLVGAYCISPNTIDSKDSRAAEVIIILVRRIIMALGSGFLFSFITDGVVISRHTRGSGYPDLCPEVR